LAGRTVKVKEDTCLCLAERSNRGVFPGAASALPRSQSSRPSPSAPRDPAWMNSRCVQPSQKRRGEPRMLSIFPPGARGPGSAWVDTTAHQGSRQRFSTRCDPDPHIGCHTSAHFDPFVNDRRIWTCDISQMLRRQSSKNRIDCLG
jgi:hypothetical protein